MDSSFFSQQMPYCLLTLLANMTLIKWIFCFSNIRPSEPDYTRIIFKSHPLANYGNFVKVNEVSGEFGAETNDMVLILDSAMDSVSGGANSAAVAASNTARRCTGSRASTQQSKHKFDRERKKHER